jgi:hypothetical protein
LSDPACFLGKQAPQHAKIAGRVVSVHLVNHRAKTAVLEGDASVQRA